ncbi:hypothetical protein J6590_025671 [Homalodisca vitripennis]|nr:hypothetical protein J6590_025671 [Homalodisca vitripennis]
MVGRRQKADFYNKSFSWHINRVQKSFEAVGFVKPGGCAKQVLNSDNLARENLNKNDFLVIRCGSNDVAKNEAIEALDEIEVTLNSITQPNIVLIDLPKRRDLEGWSCVNTEILKTNAHLKNLCNRFPNVTLVEASKAERQFHTRHGQHFNDAGKDWLAKLIVEATTGRKTQSQHPHLTDEQPPPPGTETPSGNSSSAFLGRNS